MRVLNMGSREQPLVLFVAWLRGSPLMIDVFPSCIIFLWFSLSTVTLTIGAFTQQIATLTTGITGIVIGLAALSYAFGVALVSSPITHFAPSLSEHGTKIKTESIKSLFYIGIYGGIVNLVTWTVALLNSIN